MALDELHARRLAAIANIFESALDRMELVLKKDLAGKDDQVICLLRQKMETIRSRLGESLKRFSIQPRNPEPRQQLAAELSRLWVVLENARPERMKGYGSEFSPADKAAWVELIEGSMSDIKEIRRIVVNG